MGEQLPDRVGTLEAGMMEVPNGAAVDSQDAGRVTVVSLDGEVILTKIMECPAGA